MFKKIGLWVALAMPTLFLLTACAKEEGEKIPIDSFQNIALIIIVVMIIGVSLGVGIPLRRAQEKAHKEYLEKQQQSEYENREMRRARQFQRKKK